MAAADDDDEDDDPLGPARFARDGFDRGNASSPLSPLPSAVPSAWAEILSFHSLRLDRPSASTVAPSYCCGVSTSSSSSEKDPPWALLLLLYDVLKSLVVVDVARPLDPAEDPLLEEEELLLLLPRGWEAEEEAPGEPGGALSREEGEEPREGEPCVVAGLSLALVLRPAVRGGYREEVDEEEDVEERLPEVELEEVHCRV